MIRICVKSITIKAAAHAGSTGKEAVEKLTLPSAKSKFGAVWFRIVATGSSTVKQDPTFPAVSESLARTTQG